MGHGLVDSVQSNVHITSCFNKQAAEDAGRGLADMVMDLLDIDSSAIGENDHLADLKIDSMQARMLSLAEKFQQVGECGWPKRWVEEGRQVANSAAYPDRCQCTQLTCMACTSHSRLFFQRSHGCHNLRCARYVSARGRGACAADALQHPAEGVLGGPFCWGRCARTGNNHADGAHAECVQVRAGARG